MEFPIRTLSLLAPCIAGCILAFSPALSAHTALAAEQHDGNIDIWWPVEGVMLDKHQPLKVLLPDRPIDTYNMHWYVDGGQWNLMHDSYENHPHKEVTIELTGWTWRGEGPYAITFVATDFDGRIVAQETVNIRVLHHDAATASAQSDAELPSSPPEEDAVVKHDDTAVSRELPITDRQPVAVAEDMQMHASPASHAGNPLQNTRLYVNHASPASRQADEWRHSRPSDAYQMEKIGSQSVAEWFGDWNGNVGQSVGTLVHAATSQDALPVFVLYNIPQRDCGSHSAGGSGSPDGYRQWIRSVADAVADRPAVIILEPDALTLVDCLSEADRETRFSLLRDAVDTLKDRGATVYIDAGHSSWVSPDDIAHRLNQAGVDRADGFALNVSNFRTTEENVAYGTQISAMTGGKHFVIDTGRNGSGPSPDNEWCNPSGRSLGQPPSTSVDHPLVDAYLWIKTPGESDGWCNGGPSAGTWWPEYALGLAERAQGQ